MEWLLVHEERRINWLGQVPRMVILLLEAHTILPMKVIMQKKGVILMCMNLKLLGKRFGGLRDQEWLKLFCGRLATIFCPPRNYCSRGE